MSYICGAPCEARNFNVVYIYIYMDLRLAKLKAVSFYLLHNVSILNQRRKLSCGTVVCERFASYKGYPNHRWGLIWYAKGKIKPPFLSSEAHKRVTILTELFRLRENP
jgi:hypothetical protein